MGMEDENTGAENADKFVEDADTPDAYEIKGTGVEEEAAVEHVEVVEDVDQFAPPATALATNGAEEQETKRRMLLAGLCQEHEQAKFEVILQTLRSILGLSAVATWADVVEKTESLVANCDTVIGNFADADETDAVVAARKEAWQADLECERLEEKLIAETARTQQLRDILQKQQRLLDMTAAQIERHDEEYKRREQAMNALEGREKMQQAQLADKDDRIAVLTDELTTMQDELEKGSKLSARLEEDLQAAVGQVAHLEVELRSTQEALSASQAECKRIQEESDRHCAEAKRHQDDAEQFRQQCNEQLERLQLQEEHFEKLRMQLQVHEAEQRRRVSYRSGGLSSRGTVSVGSFSPAGHADDDALSLAGTDASAEPGSVSARSGRVASGYSSVAATPRLGNRGTNAAAPSVTATMSNEERDAFLSHFPMASRTERIMRDRLEERRRMNAIASGASSAQ